MLALKKILSHQVIALLRKQNVLLNRVYYIALIIHQGISIEEECYKMLTECTMYESVRHF